MYPGFHPDVGTSLALAAADLVDVGGTASGELNRWHAGTHMSLVAVKREREALGKEARPAPRFCFRPPPGPLLAV